MTVTRVDGVSYPLLMSVNLFLKPKILIFANSMWYVGVKYIWVMIPTLLCNNYYSCYFPCRKRNIVF